jgi:hypothetical protein
VNPEVVQVEAHRLPDIGDAEGPLLSDRGSGSASVSPLQKPEPAGAKANRTCAMPLPELTAALTGVLPGRSPAASSRLGARMSIEGATSAQVAGVRTGPEAGAKLDSLPTWSLAVTA